MHQTSNKGQWCQQPNYKELAIKTALTKRYLRLLSSQNHFKVVYQTEQSQQSISLILIAF